MIYWWSLAFITLFSSRNHEGKYLENAQVNTGASCITWAEARLSPKLFTCRWSAAGQPRPVPLTAALTPPLTATGPTLSMRITGTPGVEKTEDGAPLVNLHRSNTESKVREILDLSRHASCHNCVIDQPLWRGRCDSNRCELDSEVMIQPHFPVQSSWTLTVDLVVRFGKVELVSWVVG